MSACGLVGVGAKKSSVRSWRCRHDLACVLVNCGTSLRCTTHGGVFVSRKVLVHTVSHKGFASQFLCRAKGAAEGVCTRQQCCVLREKGGARVGCFFFFLAKTHKTGHREGRPRGLNGTRLLLVLPWE